MYFCDKGGHKDCDKGATKTPAGPCGPAGGRSTVGSRHLLQQTEELLRSARANGVGEHEVAAAIEGEGSYGRPTGRRQSGRGLRVIMSVRQPVGAAEHQIGSSSIDGDRHRDRIDRRANQNGDTARSGGNR